MVAIRSRRYVLLPLLLLGILLVTAADVFPIRHLMMLNREAEGLQLKLEEIQVENVALEREIESLYSPAGIERIARADFGYVNPGETSYVVILEDDPFPQFGPEEPDGYLPEVPESVGFWRALWNFITGHDQTDG
ncbi:MAG: septum formation initiator family protein [Acidimicrobiia bacterium]|nr:septum formation initiator family protein [bacterium]MXX64684.1 septum formation initiator family protein [Acidimicrobiia bacterium]MXZ06314.1 septum formation initiator family protein [Acidimicrobiia bacterium]MYD03681.1 septum formation initiator family protein [Acidimicrobiia bacterium]MYH55230.1 septum formation initiator family protein [Acidimicrobiia bacterium]